MRSLFSFILILSLVGGPVYAETPPARSINAQLYDGSGANAITATTIAGKKGLDISVINALASPANTQVVVGGVAVDPRQIRALTAADIVSVQQTGTWNVGLIGSVPLPTGAATEATLSSIDSKIVTTVNGIKVDIGASVLSGTVFSKTQDGAGTSITSTLNGGKQSLDVNVSGSALPTGAATEATISALNTKVVTTANGIKVDGSAVTQPVSVASSALPTGAATEATLSALNAKHNSLGQKGMTGSMPVVIASDQTAVPVTNTNLDVGLSTRASESTLTTRASESTLGQINGKIKAFDLDSGAGTDNVQGVNLRFSASGGSIQAGTASAPIRTDPIGVTIQPVSGTVTANIGTAGGLATETTLALLNGKFNSLGQKLSAASVPVVLASDATSAVTQSGTWNVNNVTGTVSLPTGAATSALQSTINTTLQASQPRKLQDGNGNIITSQASGVQRALDVGINVSGVQVDPRAIRALSSGTDTIAAVQAGTWTVTTNVDSVGFTGAAVPAKATFVGGTDGTNLRAIKVSSTGVVAVDGSAVTQPVSAASLPLPTGASTSALQTSGNASLTSIDGKLNSLGQKAMTGSVPVVIASDQSSLPVTVVNSSLAEGTDGAAPPSKAVQIAGVNGGNLEVLKVDSNGELQVDVLSSALPSGAATAALQTTLNGHVDGIEALLTTIENNQLPNNHQVVVSASALPTGAATSANQTTAIGHLADIETAAASIDTDFDVVLSSRASEATLSTLNGKIPANLTVTATRLLVDGSGVTQPISAVALPLPTGASTSAAQTTGNNSLASIDTDFDVALSTRASAANQTTGNASLASLDTDFDVALSTRASESTLSAFSAKFNSLGQKTMANSAPVVIASDQSAIPASQSGTWNINNVSGTVSLPTGASTLAEQQTQTTALQLIDDTVNGINTAFNKGLAISGQFDDASTTAATEDNVAPARITAQRAVHTNLRNASGTEIGTAGAPVRTDPTGTTSQPVTNATAANLNAQVVGNIASGSADSGNPVKIGGVFNTTQPTLTNGQRGDIQLSSRGAQIVAGSAATGAAPIDNPLSVSGVDGGGLKRHIRTDTNGAQHAVGDVASGAADSGNPVKVGGKYNATMSAVTSGQRSDLQTNQFGELAVTTRNKSHRQAGNTAGTTIKSGAGRLHSVCVGVNNGAGTLDIYDNTTVTGTPIMTFTTSNNNAAQSFCTGILGVELATGLTIVVTNGAAQIYTILYQ